MKLSVLLLTVLFPATLIAQEPVTKYCPLKVGNRWDYRFTLGDQKFTMTNKITATETVEGVELYRMETSRDGQVGSTEHLRITDQGLFRHKFNGNDIQPPFQILRSPVKEGDTWKSELTIGGQKASASSKVGREEVTVPAGKYKAITVSIDTEIAGQKITTTYWFAEGVGIVKQTLSLPENRSATMELEKVELAK